MCLHNLIAFLIPDLLYMTEVADGVDEFRRCYNTSLEMHCFAVQYDTSDRPLTTYNDNARKRCNALNSNLIIIKDEATNNIVNSYISDPSNPIKNQYIWTDAFRVNDYDTHTWHWVNLTLPIVPGSELKGVYYSSTSPSYKIRLTSQLSRNKQKKANFALQFVCARVTLAAVRLCLVGVRQLDKQLKLILRKASRYNHLVSVVKCKCIKHMPQ